MRILVIDEATIAQAQEIIRQATLEPYSVEQIAALASGFDPQNPETRGKGAIDQKFTMGLFDGYTASYTHECQPCGLCRHLSVSVDTPGRVSTPAALEQIMALFHFKNLLMQCTVWLEHYSEEHIAVNVLEPIDEDGESEAATKGPNDASTGA